MLLLKSLYTYYPNTNSKQNNTKTIIKLLCTAHTSSSRIRQIPLSTDVTTSQRETVKDIGACYTLAGTFKIEIWSVTHINHTLYIEWLNMENFF